VLGLARSLHASSSPCSTSGPQRRVRERFCSWTRFYLIPCCHILVETQVATEVLARRNACRSEGDIKDPDLLIAPAPRRRLLLGLPGRDSA